MPENIQRFVSRKRPASEEVQCEVIHKDILEFPPYEKKTRQSRKVCLRCLARESGHITHILSEIPSWTKE